MDDENGAARGGTNVVMDGENGADGWRGWIRWIGR